MDSLKDKWLQLKTWQSAIWLPVLPPVGALAELAFLTAMILAVDWMLPNVDLADVEPSPYWLPVLLLSLQYGTVAGLLAAAVATAAYIFNGFPEQAIGENLFSYLLRIWALPMLWVGASLILGQFRLRQIEVKQRLQRELDQRRAEAHSLAGYSTDLEVRCRGLERQLAISTAGKPAEVLKVLAGLGSPDQELARAFTSVCQTIFPGAQLSLFAATPFGFSSVATAAWPDAARWLKELTSTHTLARAVHAERRVLSVLRPGDEALLANQGLIVQPVIAADGGRVVGFIKVEAADAQLIDVDMPARLGVMARLLAPSLGEPRVIVNNDAREISDATAKTQERPHDKTHELTKGWRQMSWRVISGADPQTAGDEVEQPAGSDSRSGRRS